MSKLSREALVDFLGYLSNKGLMNKTTASARKAAVGKVLGILDATEAEDVSQIDLDDTMNRFHNLEGANYTPESLSAYKSRVKSAIDDFIRYQKDPLNFKPVLQGGSRRPIDKTKNNARSTAEPARVRASTQIEPPPTSVSILPIPIRPDLTIKIQGLPYDLTPAEANKIAAVVKAMAAEV